MNRSVSRFLSLFLCVAMLVSLAACGKGQPSEQAQGASASGSGASEAFFTPAWETEFVTLQTDGNLWGLRPVLYTDGGFYATASVSLGRREVPAGQVEEYEGQYDIYGTVICFVDFSGSVTALPNYVPDQPAENTEGYRDFYSYCTPGRPILNSEGHLALLETREAGWYAGPDEAWGNAFAYTADYTHRETSVDIIVLDTTGAELSRARVAAEPGDAYLNITSVAPGPGGSILAAMDERLLCIGTDGALLWTADAGNMLSGLITLSDGSVSAMGFNENGETLLRPVDLSAHSLGEAQVIPSSVWSPVPGNGDYDLFFSGGLSLYGLRIGGTPEPVLDWLDCDINGQTLDAGALNVEADGTVRGLISDYEGGREVTRLFTLRRAAEGSAREKAVLSLAQLQFYPDYSLVNRVLRYNRSHDDVRIVFRDYSVYNTGDDMTAALDALLDDVLSGNAPDLFPLDNLPYRQLAARGALEDLYPYLDADSELQRSDFFPNVLAALECGGGLYQAAAGFTVDTLVGPKDLVGSAPGWTWEDFFTAYEQLPEGSSVLGPFLTRSDALSLLLSLNFDRFVDWQTGDSDFESEEFRQILRFVSLLPEEVDWDAFDVSSGTAQRFSSRQQMLEQTSLHSPDALLWNDSEYGEEGSFTYIGWPVEEGVGSALRPDSGFAMSSACSHKDAAWAFLRDFLTESGQQTVGTLPLNRRVLEQALQELMTVEYRTAADGSPLLDASGQPVQQSRVSWYDDDGSEHNIYSMSQAQADRVQEIISGCTRLAGADGAIFSLVHEQAELLFSGELTVDEVARLTQSKVSNYLRGQVGEP